MKTNIEKWKHYKTILKQRDNVYVKEAIDAVKNPKQYFQIDDRGAITIVKIYGTHYSHAYEYTYFGGKKPTRIEVNALQKYVESEVIYNYSNIKVKCRQENMSFYESLETVIDNPNTSFTVEGVFEKAEKIKTKYLENKAFDKKYAKYEGYNYEQHGYKFLGWQNNWHSVQYDKNNKLCSETGNPPTIWGYTKEEYPEYRKCIDAKHRLIHVSIGHRGTEHIESCPICKVYWKYDSSD